MLTMESPCWTRSSYCADTACVEVAPWDGGVAIRDGKNRHQPALQFTHAEWNAFLDAVNAGDFQGL